MKQLLFVLPLALLFSCASPKKEGTIISGTIPEYSQKQIILQSSLFIDTVVTDENGSFEHAVDLKEPSFVRLSSEDKRLAAIVLLEPDEQATVTITNSEDWQQGFGVSGSKGSALLVELNNHYNASLSVIEQIRTDYNDAMKTLTPGSEEHRQLSDASGAKYDSIIQQEIDFLVEFIKKNASSFAAISALYQTFDYRTGKPLILEEKEGLKYFQLVDSALTATYPEATDVKAFHKNYMQIKAQLEKQSVEATSQSGKVGIGQIAPEIVLPNTKGADISLSSLRGKYVLVDFWASWCAPCRMENPALVKAYNQFSSKGFEIFQVSLDKTKEAWTGAIQRDGLVWDNHCSDLQFWNSAAAKLYGVQSIPASFLLDKEGRVVAQNLRGEELMLKLGELLN